MQLPSISNLFQAADHSADPDNKNPANRNVTGTQSILSSGGGGGIAHRDLYQSAGDNLPFYDYGGASPQVRGITSATTGAFYSQDGNGSYHRINDSTANSPHYSVPNIHPYIPPPASLPHPSVPQLYSVGTSSTFSATGHFTDSQQPQTQTQQHYQYQNIQHGLNAETAYHRTSSSEYPAYSSYQPAAEPPRSRVHEIPPARPKHEAGYADVLSQFAEIAESLDYSNNANINSSQQTRQQTYVNRAAPAALSRTPPPELPEFERFRPGIRIESDKKTRKLVLSAIGSDDGDVDKNPSEGDKDGHTLWLDDLSLIDDWLTICGFMQSFSNQIFNNTDGSDSGGQEGRGSRRRLSEASEISSNPVSSLISSPCFILSALIDKKDLRYFRLLISELMGPILEQYEERDFVHVIIDNSLPTSSSALAGDLPDDYEENEATNIGTEKYRDDVRISSSLPIEENTAGKLFHLLVRSNREEFLGFHPEANAIWMHLERTDMDSSSVDMISALSSYQRSIIIQFLIMEHLDSVGDLSQFTDERLSQLSELLRKVRDESRTIKDLQSVLAWTRDEIESLREASDPDAERRRKELTGKIEGFKKQLRVICGGQEDISGEEYLRKWQTRILLERHNLQNLPLGRDRRMRAYWVFPGLPGLFVTILEGGRQQQKRTASAWLRVNDIEQLKETLDRYDWEEQRLKQSLVAYIDFIAASMTAEEVVIDLDEAPSVSSIDLRYDEQMLIILKRLSCIIIQPFIKSPRSPKYRHYSTLRAAWSTELPSGAGESIDFRQTQKTVLSWLELVNRASEETAIAPPSNGATASNNNNLIAAASSTDTAESSVISPSTISPLLFCFLPHDTKMIRPSEMNAVRRALKRLFELVSSNGNRESLLFYLRILEATIDETVEEDENYAGIRFSQDPWRPSQHQLQQEHSHSLSFKRSSRAKIGISGSGRKGAEAEDISEVVINAGDKDKSRKRVVKVPTEMSSAYNSGQRSSKRVKNLH